jgi:hypothetical protein
MLFLYCAFGLGEFNKLETTVRDKSVCSNQKIFKLAEQKIWEIAVNEKICEKIPLHSAWRNGGAQRGCKGRLWPNCQANI